MFTFDVAQWQQQFRHGSSMTSMSQPEEVTCWTKTGLHQGSQFLFGDRSGLCPYIRPQLPADLNQGYPHSYTAKPEGERSPVDTIILAAAAAAVDWQYFDVCTYRNNMNKILLTPLGGRDGWQMDACFHERTNTLFLDIVPGPQASYPGADKFTYYGYKFEAVCTGNGPEVDATSEFGVVLTYQLGAVRLLMAAEIDAAQQPAAAGGGAAAGQLPYVEMKTYNIPRHGKACADMYTIKHPRWWVQSYLAGVPTLVLGGRDATGKLLKVQEVPVQALPGLSAHAGHPWDPQQLLSFGEAFLVWLKELAAAHPNTQLRCRCEPGSGVIQVDVTAGDMPARLEEVLKQE